MWEYNHPNELMHYGKKGMKWGQRRAIRKQVDKEQKKLISKRESELVSGSAAIQKHRSEAARLAKKYNLDEDDGGGGSTKKARDAGYRYVKHLEASEAMQESYHSKAVKEANSALHKKYGDDVLKQIGRNYISNY